MLRNNYRVIDGFTLIELMVVIAITSILAAIAIPNYISYRNKGYCSQAETDGENVSMAIADYYGVGSHTGLPSIDDLKIHTENPVTISGDPNTTITITVTDRTERCPKDYTTANYRWDSDSHTYTKWIK